MFNLLRSFFLKSNHSKSIAWRRRHDTRPRLEALEDRSLLAALVWYHYSSTEGPATTLIDASGNGYNATATGSEFVADRPPNADLIPGVPLTAGSFKVDGGFESGATTNATNLYTNASIQANGGFTMETWFRRDGANNSFNGYQKLMQGELENFFVPSFTDKVGWSDGLTPPPIFATANVGEWHHVAAVFDSGSNALVSGTISGELRLYFDGNLAYSQPETLAATRDDIVNNPTWIGRSNSGVESFNGELFETRISLGALAPSDLLLPRFHTNSPPSTPVDADTAANSVVEGATNGSAVGITALASDADGDHVTYTLTNDADGRFAIDSATGVVSVANSSLLDGPASQTITVQANDGNGGSSSADFTIEVANVAPTAVFASNGPVTYGDTAVVSFANQHDDSSADSAAGFHYAYSLTGNFSGVNYASGSSSDASQEYAGLNAGNYTVYARIIDKDDGFTDYSTVMVVNKAALSGFATTQDALNIAKQGSLSFALNNITGLIGTDTVIGVFSQASFTLRFGTTGHTYTFQPTVTIDTHGDGDMANDTVILNYSLKNGGTAGELAADLAALDAADDTASTSASNAQVDAIWVDMSTDNYWFSDDALTRIFSSKK
jgi:hypothetical protein